MSVLLKEIKRIYLSAGNKLEALWLQHFVSLKTSQTVNNTSLSGLQFCTDSDLRSLTREDLQELFPGEGSLRMRKTIFKIIHKQRPIGLLLNEVKDLIPDESLRAAFSNTGVLEDYLLILKDMKAQMDSVQTFLDAHISLLENIDKTQYDKKPGGFEVIKDNGQDPKETAGSWFGSSSLWPTTEPQKSRPEDSPQSSKYASAATSQVTTGGPEFSVNPTHASPPPARRTIKYKMTISGNTFNAHLQILNRVQRQDSSVSLNLVESSDFDSDITLLFCPISSRAGTNIEAAMKSIKGDERVILVVMRHSREAKSVTSMRTWCDFSQVVLHVNVFFHDTVNGLLDCQENTNAITKIREELLKHSYETVEASVVNKHGSLEKIPSESDFSIRRSNSEKKPGFFNTYGLFGRKNY